MCVCLYSSHDVEMSDNEAFFFAKSIYKTAAEIE